MRKRGNVWQLRVQNSPEVRAATGRKFTVHSLGRDTAQAIAEAERIKKGDKNLDLDKLAEELSQDHSEGADYVRSDIADRIAEKDEAKAIAWFRRASGRDADLKSLAAHNREVISEKTYSTRIEAINRAGIKWLSDVPDRREAVALTDKLIAQKLSRSTVSLTVRTLNTLWRIAIDRGIIAKSPFERLEVRVPRTEKRALTPQEFRQVVTLESNELARSLVVFLGMTGCRVGEALDIRPEHCERDTVRIVKSKTRAGVRTIVLSRAARKALDVMLKNGPTKYDAAHRFISRAYKRAGIERVDLHSLRRTCAQALLDCEVPEHVAAAMIGHAHRPLTFGLYAARGPGLQQLRQAALAVERHLLT